MKNLTVHKRLQDNRIKYGYIKGLKSMYEALKSMNEQGFQHTDIRRPILSESVNRVGKCLAYDVINIRGEISSTFRKCYLQTSTQQIISNA